MDNNIDKGTVKIEITMLYNRVSYLENEVNNLNKIVSELLSMFTEEQEIEDNNKARKFPPPPTRALPYPLSSNNVID